MIHLIISREYPPAVYPPGGIGSYVVNIARLLAERGETVHIVGQRWEGAPLEREERHGGRLVIHRIAEGDVAERGWAGARGTADLEGLKRTAFPEQWFSWAAAFFTEHLVESEGIDVIEGQEWEAPLYYFLLRRSLGLGPARRPPVIVHIHSPTEIIHTFNGAPSIPPAFTTMKRMEAYCIANADGRLCPSRYLTQQAAERFKIAADDVKVIPLPVGFTDALNRPDEVWRAGSICFVGRIEPRKGVVEWFEAARRVAGENPAARFDFVGADNWSIQETLLARLPPEWLPRFRFHGSKPREELPDYLARAMAGVVPSRWENFPNVCIEAMSSGLPVIATRLGGMVELLEDGQTGWLAPDTGVAGMVDGLAEALRRCLATPADQRARMGEAAAKSIRQICDNGRVVDEHIRFRREVMDRGARRFTAAVRANSVPTDVPSGAGVILHAERISDLARVAASIRAQSLSPRRVVIVCPGEPAHDDSIAAMLPNTTVVVSRTERGAAAWNRGLTALHADGLEFLVFLDEHDELHPDCLASLASVMRRRPDIGIVSFWVEGAGGSGEHDIAPCPEPLYQVIANDVRTASAFRSAALVGPEPFRAGLPRGYDIWDVANKVLVRGWSAVTFPGTLSRRDAASWAVRWPDSTALRSVRAELVKGLCDSAAGLDAELIDLFVPIPYAQTASSIGSTPVANEAPREGISRYVERALLHPVESMQAVHRAMRRRIARLREPRPGRRVS